jgi:hypothetical protein
MGVLLSLAATTAMGQTGSHDKGAQSSATVRCTDLEGRPEPCPEQKETSDNDRYVVPTMTQDAWNLLRGVVNDQGYLWTRPLHLHLRDAEWFVPVAGIAAGLIVTDRTASHEISRGSHRGLSNEFSDAGVGALGLAAGSLYVFGRRSGDGRKHETGLLAAEAGIDSLAVDEALKYAFRRERPYQDSGRGLFSQPGGSSFPSAHAATAFALATVIAHEYPEPFKQVLAYCAASAISLARVKGQQHFPSDVFVGGAMGYLIGRSVYRKHHDPSVENYGVFVREPSALPASSMSSTYIELDSWIYPAVARLAALGVVKLEFLGLRPWTRMAVYQMLGQASESELEPTVGALVSVLQKELQREADVDSGGLNRAISIDQIYTRTQYISGQPLNDSYHFGQTVVDDFGRPYGHGPQQIIGFESRAEQGRFSFFARGEYQHSPSIPGYSPDVEQIIARQDSNPVQTFNGLPSANAFRLLDTYVSMKLLGNEISAGKQSYWWGPGEGSAMMLGDNAEPFYSLRINRTVPWHIPLLSKLLGPARYDNFFGKLSGHHSPPNPFFYGQKISFRPSENLEFGFARDAVFAGQGISPLTIGSFWNSFTSLSTGTSPGFQLRTNPGARHSSFDFTYRVPGLRDWLTFYTDSVIHDGISPIESPRRSALTPGIYLARFPEIPKLDLHIEGGTTDTTPARAEGGQFYYWEAIYRDAYTNKGYLLGSWLGREGTGGQAWATYWFSPKSTLRIGYRTVKVSHFFVPRGETQQDGYAELNCQWRNGLGVRVFVQGERWVAPALASGPQTDVTTQIQLSFSPKNWSVTKR